MRILNSVSFELFPNEILYAFLSHLTPRQREAVSRVSYVWRFLTTSLIPPTAMLNGKAFYRDLDFQDILHKTQLAQKIEDLLNPREVHQANLRSYVSKINERAVEFFIQVVNCSEHHILPDDRDIDCDQWIVHINGGALKIDRQRVNNKHKKYEDWVRIRPENGQWICFSDPLNQTILHIFMKIIGSNVITHLKIQQIEGFWNWDDVSIKYDPLSMDKEDIVLLWEAIGRDFTEWDCIIRPFIYSDPTNLSNYKRAAFRSEDPYQFFCNDLNNREINVIQAIKAIKENLKDEDLNDTKKACLLEAFKKIEKRHGL